MGPAWTDWQLRVRIRAIRTKQYLAGVLNPCDLNGTIYFCSIQERKKPMARTETGKGGGERYFRYNHHYIYLHSASCTF